ncbi:MAG: glycosyltransferase [Gemmatimonadota bacterium]
MRATSSDGTPAADGISVIVIARNAARHLADALDSIAASTLQPREVIVVDGGSPDDTVAIARRYPFVWVVPQRSRGIAEAYNEGIEASTQPLLAFLSADDRWMPDKLARQAASLQADPSLGLVACHVLHALEPGCAPPAGFRLSLLDGPVPAFIMESLMVRRTVFAQVGGFDPAFAVSEDTDWFARTRDAGVRSAVLDETLVWKRVHDANSSLNEPSINGLLLRALRGTLQRKRAQQGQG